MHLENNIEHLLLEEGKRTKCIVSAFLLSRTCCNTFGVIKAGAHRRF